MSTVAMLPPLSAATSQNAPYQEDTAHGHNPGHSQVVVFEQTIDVEEDVTDFFDARFSSRQDLANIKALLKQQTELGQDLNHKVNSARFFHMRARAFFLRLHALPQWPNPT